MTVTPSSNSGESSNGPRIRDRLWTNPKTGRVYRVRILNANRRDLAATRAVFDAAIQRSVSHLQRNHVAFKKHTEVCLCGEISSTDDKTKKVWQTARDTSEIDTMRSAFAEESFVPATEEHESEYATHMTPSSLETPMTKPKRRSKRSRSINQEVYHDNTRANGLYETLVKHPKYGPQLQKFGQKFTGRLPGIGKTDLQTVHKNHLDYFQNHGRTRTHVNTRFHVANMSSLDAAATVRKGPTDIPFVLSFGNRGLTQDSRGGGWKRGANAQEETIHRRTAQSVTTDDSYSSFYRGPQRSPYVNPSTGKQGLPQTGGMVTRTLVCRKGAQHGYRLIDGSLTGNQAGAKPLPVVDVGTVCALDKSKSSSKPHTLTAPELVTTKKIMYQALRMAELRGSRRVVLGALGCGAFNNNPDQIAEAWMDVIQKYFPGVFEDIVFAVQDRPGGKNIQAFSNIVGTRKPTTALYPTPVGLNNSSNTCWANSLIQSILHNFAYSRSFRAYLQAGSTQGRAPFARMKVLLRDYENRAIHGGGGSINFEKDILAFFRVFSPHLQGNEAFDPADAFNAMMQDYLAYCFNQTGQRRIVHGKYQRQAGETLPVTSQLENYNTKNGTQTYLNPFIQLNLPTKNKPHLTDLLDGHFERGQHTLGGGHVGQTFHSRRFENVPDALPISLRRRSRNPIGVPFQITLPGRYISDVTKSTANHSYFLISFIVHRPNHYVSYIFRGDQWYECDDRRVRKVTHAEATYAAERSDMVFYRRSENRNTPAGPTDSFRSASQQQGFLTALNPMLGNYGRGLPPTPTPTPVPPTPT